MLSNANINVFEQTAYTCKGFDIRVGLSTYTSDVS